MSDDTGNGFKVPTRLLTYILVVALLISYVVFERISNPGTSAFRINIIVPWGLITVFMSFYLFNEFNRVKKAKREERREYMNEHRQELLNNVLKKNKATKTIRDSR